MTQELRIQSAAIVYQSGIANVFKVDQPTCSPDTRNAVRLMQSDFRTCAAFARGLRAAGCDVRTAGCNKAGDVTAQPWTNDYDALPFSDSFELVGGVADA